MKRALFLGLFTGLTISLWAAEKSPTPDPSHFTVPYVGWVVDGQFLLIFGLIGQCLFFGRMVVQLWASARSRASVVPPFFWYLSLTAGVMLGFYFFIRSDPVGLLQQIIMCGIYLRHIYLMWRSHLEVSFRRRMGAAAAITFGALTLLMILALWLEGPRELANEPDPDYFFVPLLNLKLVAWPCLIFGFLGMAVFSGRFLLSWMASEKARESVVPPSFWVMAQIGSIMLLFYFFIRSDPIGMLGQITGIPSYAFNLYLIARGRCETK